MIFVTLGSQKFPMNRLLEEVDRLLADGFIHDEVIGQVGYSDYPASFPCKPFMENEEFKQYLYDADLVITHAGTATIIKAAKEKKRIIVVPRLAKYGEHVDDHQMQIADMFEEAGLLVKCEDTGNLKEAIEEAMQMTPPGYQSNTDRFLQTLDDAIKELTTNKRKQVH